MPRRPAEPVVVCTACGAVQDAGPCCSTCGSRTTRPDPVHVKSKRNWIAVLSVAALILGSSAAWLLLPTPTSPAASRPRRAPIVAVNPFARGPMQARVDLVAEHAATLMARGDADFVNEVARVAAEGTTCDVTIIPHPIPRGFASRADARDLHRFLAREARREDADYVGRYTASVPPESGVASAFDRVMAAAYLHCPPIR